MTTIHSCGADVDLHTFSIKKCFQNLSHVRKMKNNQKLIHRGYSFLSYVASSNSAYFLSSSFVRH